MLLAHKPGPTAVVFGQFRVERLSGFTPAGSAAVSRALGDRVEYHPYDTPRTVERGCGSYVVHGEFTIRDTAIVQVVDALKGVEDPGKLMVGGSFQPLFAGDSVNAVACVDRVRLKRVPFAQGFRPVDYPAFRREVLAAVERNPARAVPVVDGYFYSVTDHAAAVAEGVGELVGDYRRGSRWEQGEIL